MVRDSYNLIGPIRIPQNYKKCVRECITNTPCSYKMVNCDIECNVTCRIYIYICATVSSRGMASWPACSDE